MKTIALMTQKGGSGKTTIASSLAVAAQEVGENVAILDLDPQQSLTLWGENRHQSYPAVDKLETSLIERLPEILNKIELKGYTLVVLDTAGVDTVSARTVMQNADLILIPSRPTAMDLRATKPTYEAAVRLKKSFEFVLNQCPSQPNNPRSNEAATALRIWGLLAEPMIMQRAAHQDAFASSMGVTEYEPNGKAAYEIRQLWNNLKSDMEGRNNDKFKKTKLVA